MKITIDVEAKEIADLVSEVQDRHSKIVKAVFKQTLSKFCDEFDLHDEELDKTLNQLTE